MKKTNSKTIIHVVLFSLIALFIIIVFMSTNTKITGFLSNRLTNVSIAVTGVNPITISVINTTLTGTTVDPTESTFNAIRFDVLADDVDGTSDINTTSMDTNFSRTGEALRQNSSCRFIANINTTAANFTCTVQMWYYDTNGAWNISVGAIDLGNLSKRYDYTNKTFSYGQLQAMVISPSSITWASVSPGAENATSNNDPTIINNTGNYNSTNITVQAISLIGETDTTKFIAAGNFSASNNTGGSPPMECNTTALTSMANILVNGSDVQINNSFLVRGNFSLNYNNQSSGQEQIYYCIKTVPSTVPSQTYSTTNGGGWTIKML